MTGKGLPCAQPKVNSNTSINISVSVSSNQNRRCLVPSEKKGHPKVAYSNPRAKGRDVQVKSVSEQFDRNGCRFAATDTEGCNPFLQAALLQGIQQRNENA